MKNKRGNKQQFTLKLFDENGIDGQPHPIENNVLHKIPEQKS